jgi:hypothetical protein
MHPRTLMRGLRREIRSVVRAETKTHEHLRDRLMTAVIVTLLVDLVATVAVYLLERHSPNTDVSTIGSALFWTTSQLLTVSSSLHNPISASARVVDVALEVYAITVVTTLAGSFAAFYHRRSQERDPVVPPASAGGGTGAPTGTPE